MTKEEIREKPETEFKLRGYSQKSIDTYKAGITTFLDWANKPYEDLDEEDFRNYLIHITQEGRLKPQTINSKIALYPERCKKTASNLFAKSDCKKQSHRSDRIACVSFLRIQLRRA